MTDVTVVILTFNEHIHLRRCLERLRPLEAVRTIVVDSESTDDTCDIARSFGAEVVVHPWPGAQSMQFNWALDTQMINSSWVLRVDADEYFTPESIEWLKANIDGIEDEVMALEFTLERRFMGGEIRHGTNGIRIVRMFRRGRGRYTNALMDERIVYEGRKMRVPVSFYDDNLNSFEWWREKHRGYAKRAARQALDGSFQDIRKKRYYKLPRYIRAIFYFIFRYFFMRGFLDGIHGFRWHFWQGLWYRWIIDVEIGALKAKQDLHGITSGQVNLAKYRNSHGYLNMAIRLLWLVAWVFGAKWTPRFVLNRWRSFLLRLFGAKIGRRCRLNGSMEVWMPSRLFMGSQVWIDRNVNLYNVDRITIGDNAIISDGAYICTASHDITKRDFPLTTAPVTIGAGAWIAAHARIMPGLTIGEGAVVGAGSVVTKDVEPWTVVAGNPAKFIKKRVIA